MAPCNGTLQWHPAMAPSNGTTSTQPSHTTNGTQQWHHVHSPKVGRHPPPNHSTLQWHPTKAPSNGTTSTAPCNGTQQWHHVHSTIAHHYGASNGNQQWHHVHSTIAHYNGTLQWHLAMAPRPFKHSTLQWHPAMAPRNGTTSTAPCNGILVPRPMRKTGSSPSPPIGSKNPYSYRYLGKKLINLRSFHFHNLINGNGHVPRLFTHKKCNLKKSVQKCQSLRCPYPQGNDPRWKLGETCMTFRGTPRGVLRPQRHWIESWGPGRLDLNLTSTTHYHLYHSSGVSPTVS